MAIAVMHLVGTAVAALGLLLHIISIATTEWLVEDDTETGVGLFEQCFKSKCQDIDNPSDELKAVRAMVLIGLIAAIVGVAIAILIFVFQLLNKGGNRLFAFAAAGLCIVAAVSNLIGVIIYGAEIYDIYKDTLDYGYSFALCIVGFILLIIGGVLFGAGAKTVS